MHVPALERVNFSRVVLVIEAVVVVLEADRLGIDRDDFAVGACEHAAAGVLGGAILHAGADDRRLRTEQRHGLTLHVRAHQGAVGVVVLEERNQRRCDRDDLLGRNVHELDLVRRLFDVFFRVARDDRGAVILPLASIVVLACATM